MDEFTYLHWLKVLKGTIPTPGHFKYIYIMNKEEDQNHQVIQEDHQVHDRLQDHDHQVQDLPSSKLGTKE